MNKGAFVEHAFRHLSAKTHGMSYDQKTALAHTLWEPVQKHIDNMAAQCNELDATIDRLTAENVVLRCLVRGELSLTDADIDAMIEKERQP